jgi:hypothetical protein
MPIGATIGFTMADNLFERPKAKEAGDKSPVNGKVDFTGRDQGERAAEPLSLLSISGIDASKAIAASRQPTAEEIASSGPVSKQRAEQSKRPEMLPAMKESDSLKSIYEDGLLKLYDDPGKSHFGFKFLEPGGGSKDRLSVSARKEKLEDLIKGISFEYRAKF